MTNESIIQLADNHLGLYIHIPFCASKCFYCDFVSFAECDSIVHEKYLTALYAEARKWATVLAGRKIDSLYIGGGTPTVLNENNLNSLFNEILTLFDVKIDAERTIEVNPRTIDEKKLAAIEKHINRVSLGVQSFNDNELKIIGRCQSEEDADSAIELIKSAKIPFNLDLIFGLPGQSVKSFQNSLQKAVAFVPNHISLYSLMLSTGTILTEMAKKGAVNLPNEEEVLLMWNAAEEELKKGDYSFYEVSNACKESAYSHHNVAYWLEREYIGLGVAASSYYSGFRIKNSSNLVDYIANSTHAAVNAEKLSSRELFFEGLAMGLRLKEGFDVSFLEKKTGISCPDNIHSEILREGNILRLSDCGFKVANQILSDITLF